MFFRFWHFWRENDVRKFSPNFVFIILGYLMIISERTHHKDVKSEKKLKYAQRLKRYNGILKFDFPAILFTCTQPRKRKGPSPVLKLQQRGMGNVHQEKWDSSPIEKIHLKVCKRYLEVNNKASNIACRAEFGRLPPLIPINIKIMKDFVCLNNKLR